MRPVCGFFILYCLFLFKGYLLVQDNIYLCKVPYTLNSVSGTGHVWYKLSPFFMFRWLEVMCFTREEKNKH